MKRLTQEYQVSDEAVTRPIIRPISHGGVEAVTAVAKTLVNRTIALGLVRVTKKPNTIARCRDGGADGSSTISCGLARRSLMPRKMRYPPPSTRTAQVSHWYF